MKRGLLAFSAIALLTGSMMACAATISPYTDRAAWRVAAGGATGDILEEFTGDNSFLPFDAGEFVVTETGDRSAFVQGGVIWADLNSQFALDTITFTFDHAIVALGFSVGFDPMGAGAHILFSTTSGDGGSYALPSSIGRAFRGFLFSAPTTTFTIRHLSGGPWNVYGYHTIDDVEAFSVPEPSTLALLGLGLGGLALSARSGTRASARRNDSTLRLVAS